MKFEKFNELIDYLKANFFNNKIETITNLETKKPKSSDNNNPTPKG